MRKINKFLNNVVRFEGYVETWVEKEKVNDVLFSQVSVREYTSNELIKEDHLWIKASHEMLNYLKIYGRLTKMEGLAKVVEYTRKDKTVDYTLKSIKYKSIDEYYSKYRQIENTFKRSKSPFKKLACIETFCLIYKLILEDLKNQVLLFPSIVSPSEIQNNFSNILDNYMLEYKKKFPKYIENGHPKSKKYLKDLSKILKETPPKSKGFKNERT